MRLQLGTALQLVFLVAAGCGGLVESGAAAAPRRSKPEGRTAMSYVRVRLIGPDGKLGGPQEAPRLVLSEAEWRKRLTPEQYRITRGKDTERAFCGGLLNNKKAGLYVCVCCNLPLFESGAKFTSGSGWPSFFRPVAVENLREEADHSGGTVRTEILCRRCGAHLGHVFEDGPRPTGRRYCLNSEALRFVAGGRLKTIAEPASNSVGPSAAAAGDASHSRRAEAVFAGGCFWCVEAVFRQLDGVLEATSGYAGGDAETANYEAVSSGRTGHAEAVKMVYDPRKISYEKLLKVHFATHDPTTLNRQGSDVGTQYRSAIFYANERQKQLAAAMIADLSDAKAYGRGRSIVTTLEPLAVFYPAEAKHQNFVACNPRQPYVQSVAMPKVEKVRAKFKNLLKSPQAATSKSHAR